MSDQNHVQEKKIECVAKLDEFDIILQVITHFRQVGSM